MNIEIFTHDAYTVSFPPDTMTYGELRPCGRKRRNGLRIWEFERPSCKKLTFVTEGWLLEALDQMQREAIHGEGNFLGIDEVLCWAEARERQ